MGEREPRIWPEIIIIIIILIKHGCEARRGLGIKSYVHPTPLPKVLEQGDECRIGRPINSIE
jgi:hypothetical protein